MKKSVLIRAALLCLLAVPAAGQVPAGLQEKMPLDGEVRVGRLDNGMTYYIRHYDNPRHSRSPAGSVPDAGIQPVDPWKWHQLQDHF